MEREDRFIDHIIKLMKHLKERGMKTIQVYCDMLAGTSAQTFGWLMDKFLAKVDENGLRDVLQMDWWTYLAFKDTLDFDNIHPELNIRSITKPWNGYYIWIILTNCMANVSYLAEMNHRDGGEGVIAYSMWDRSYDRTHDWIAIVQMYDLCNAGKLREAAPLALERRQGRLELMAHCEQAKEAFFCKALAMRTHSIFMQMFTDLAAYMQTAEEAPLDLCNAYHIMSPKFRSLQ